MYTLHRGQRGNNVHTTQGTEGQQCRHYTGDRGAIMYTLHRGQRAIMYILHRG